MINRVKKSGLFLAMAILLTAVFSSCETASSGKTNKDAVVSINNEERYQTIDGFGGALPMWVSNASRMLTEEEIQKFTGMGDDEMGISLVRTIISPNPSNWPNAVANLQQAKETGSDLRILATPWTPPAEMKDNKSTVGGGTLLPEFYQDYADHLNAYIEYMDEQGVEIDVVSLQNEPDWHPDYESCSWTGEQYRDFLRDYGDQIINAEVLVGESLRFDRAYTDPSLKDEGALENFEYVGGHLYSCESSWNLKSYPLAETNGKNPWMTEYLIHDADGSGAPIWGGDDLAVWDETLDEVVRTVHKTMEANWSAYIWWWMRRFYSFMGDGEEQFGTVKSEILKRGWAFSHYSKFVRPGYVRIGAAATNGLAVTAYEGGGRIVMVMLNRSRSSFKNLEIDLPVEAITAEAFITSQFRNRENLEIELVKERTAEIPFVEERSIITAVFTY